MSDSVASATIGSPAPDAHTSKDSRPVVCVFCGASPGNSPTHLAAARALASAMAERNYRLVYGGGTVGLMGEVARTLVKLSGPDSVHGIIPQALVEYEQQGRPQEGDNGVEKEGPRGDPFNGEIFGKTTIVKDMHTRKQAMAREVIEGGEGSGFVALSGGYGTLEELMEVTTWNQLGIHNRGVVLYNVEGYWDGLITWVKSAVTQGFISGSNAGILVEALDAEECIQQLKEYKNSEGRFKLQWGQN